MLAFVIWGYSKKSQGSILSTRSRYILSSYLPLFLCLSSSSHWHWLSVNVCYILGGLLYHESWNENNAWRYFWVMQRQCRSEQRMLIPNISMWLQQNVHVLGQHFSSFKSMQNPETPRAWTIFIGLEGHWQLNWIMSLTPSCHMGSFHFTSAFPFTSHSPYYIRVAYFKSEMPLLIWIPHHNRIPP